MERYVLGNIRPAKATARRPGKRMAVGSVEQWSPPSAGLLLLTIALIGLAVLFTPGGLPAEAQAIKPNPPENVTVTPGTASWW